MKPSDIAALTANGLIDEAGLSEAGSACEPELGRTAPEPRPFPAFFQAEWPKLKTYLRRFVSGDEAEDLAQEAFTRVYTAKDVRSPSGLLYRIARNLLIDRRRRRSASRIIEAEDDLTLSVADPQHSPEEQLVLRERVQRAQRMLDHMPTRCREIFLLQVIDGMSYAEIAERKGVSVVAVKKQLLRAFEICAAHAAREGHKRTGPRERAQRERNNK